MPNPPDLSIPTISVELMDYLSRIYPDRFPDISNLSERDLWKLHGERSVVKHLMTLFDRQRQSEEGLNPNVLRRR